MDGGIAGDGAAGDGAAGDGVVGDGGTLVVDNRGQSLLLTGHVLVNLLGSHAAERGAQPFEVVGVIEDRALAGLRLELRRYGILLDIEACSGGEAGAPGSFSGTVRVGEDPLGLAEEYRAAMQEFLVDGRTVSATTFWNIYYRGNAGLDTDTPISRQHTGGTVLDVIRPGEQITKQFSVEELHLLTDPDELDNQNLAAYIDTE